MKHRVLILLLCFACIPFSNSYGQLTVNTSVTAQALAQDITGPNVVVSNAVLTCPALHAGLFTGTNSNVGISNGVLLSTGNARDAIGPNNNIGIGAGCNKCNPGTDPNLSVFIGGPTYDECKLEFDLIPKCDSLQINYVFASEEYLTWVNTPYHDVFGFFLTGPNPSGGTYTSQNIALVPGTNQIVTINNIFNDPRGLRINYPLYLATSGLVARTIGTPLSNNGQFYKDNGNGNCVPAASCLATAIQYNGMTVPMLAKARVTPCQSYHMKLIIGDGEDDQLDSGVFLTHGGLDCLSPPGLQLSTSFALTCSQPNQGTATVSTVKGTPPYTYTWNTVPAQNTATATGLSAGTYKVTVADNACFVDSITVTLTSPGPVLNATTSSNATCNGLANGAATVSATTGLAPFTYAWSNGQINASATGLAAGTPSVTVTDANGCTSTSSVTITEPTALSVTASTIPATCGNNNGSATASASGGTAGYTYLWNTTPTQTTTAAITNLAAGTYSVTATDSKGCTVSNAGILVGGPANSVVLGNDTSLCTNQPIVIDAGNTPGTTYLWSTNATTQSISPTSSGTYSVTATDVNGCTASGTKRVTFVNPPTVNLFADTAVCVGSPVIINAANPGSTYLWSDASTGQTLSPTTNGTYSVTVTNATGCSASDAKQVTFNPIPVVNLFADTSICTGAPVTIDAANTGSTYLWSNNATTQTISPTTNGTYAVTVTANGCTATDDKLVTFITAPVVNLFADTAVCVGAPIVIDAANTGSTYLWSDGSTTQTINPTTNGTYSVTVTNATGCTATDAKLVTFNPYPVVNLFADTSVCVGAPVVINAANVGSTYLWSTSATTQTISPTTNGTYSVTVNSNGCTATDAKQVSFIAAPNVNLFADTAVCIGSPVIIDAANAGSTYLWSDGSTTQTISPTTNGTYAVTVTNSNNCSASDAKQVTFNAYPVVNLFADTSVCIGASVIIDAANVGSTYLWNTSATTRTISPTTNGTYSVTVNSNGCTATDSKVVTFNALPVVNLFADTAVCAGSPITIDAANVGSTYLWSNAATTQTITPTVDGNYSVTVTNSNNCSASDTKQVTFNPIPVVTLAAAPIVKCEGDAVTLDAGYPGSSYHWSNSQVTQTISPTITGVYDVTVTTSALCVGSGSISVTFNQLPAKVLSNASTCIGNDIAFDAGNPGSTYLWSNNATTQINTVNTGGTYSVTITNTTTQCSVVDAATATFTSPGSIDLGADASICTGQTKQLDATFAGANYLWSDGSTSPTVTATQPGTYSVTLTVNGHCLITDDITLAAATEVALTLADSAICEDNSIVLNAGNPGALYTWSTGATTPTITVSEEGVYGVVVANSCNTVAAEMHLTTRDCNCYLYMPTAFSPNGDGINDQFAPVRFCDSLLNFHMRVYDRWGEVVFESTDVAVGWKGDFNGLNLPPDVYIWQMTYTTKEDGEWEDKAKRGSISISR